MQSVRTSGCSTVEGTIRCVVASEARPSEASAACWRDEIFTVNDIASWVGKVHILSLDRCAAIVHIAGEHVW